MAKKRRVSRPVRELGRRFCIFCEGENTEPCYLERYRTLNGYGKEIEIAKINKNTPLQLVEAAICEKERREKEISKDKQDEFWVVFDREDTSNRTKDLMYHTFKKAQLNNINIAISNVCFEVWLLLHLENSKPASYYSQTDLVKQSCLIDRLKELNLPTDTKRKANVERIMLALVKNDLIIQARTIAISMNDDSKNCSQEDLEYEFNPYTAFYKLLDAIDVFVGKKKD